jgi:outer membrane protein
MKRTVALMVLAALGSVGVAQAYEKGDFIARAGIAWVAPNDDSGNVLGADDGVTVDDAVGVGLTGSYFFSKNIAVELLGALPFSHDIEGDGSLDGVAIGNVKQLPPTVSVQYYFGNGDNGFHPYVGAGINYTIFFDEDVDSELEEALGTKNVDLKLTSSVGFALQAGVDYEINENLFASATAYYLDIDTRADVEVEHMTATEVDVDINPLVAMFSIGYKF